MPDAKYLQVFLYDIPIGRMRHLDETITFSFNSDYRSLIPRPVLGQAFEDRLSIEYRTKTRVPPWFANLLPEGPLRELLAKLVGVSSTRDFFLLAHLGTDLPGAITVLPETDADAVDDSFETTERAANSQDAGEGYEFKFSLAGVQLKFSVLVEGKGLSIPLHGQSGDYIAKLPDSRYIAVPENEWTMMTWARAIGIAVPEFFLQSVATIAGLPEEVAEIGGEAFVVRRFDRTPSGPIHIEDFAQVIDVYPGKKYTATNYESLARILLATSGLDDVHELVRRLIAIVVMGNGDAHLKNFSLIYPDRQHARLSPAYDLVSTHTYARTTETLALNLARSKSFEEVRIGSFQRMARVLKLESEHDLDSVVQETVTHLRDMWPAVRQASPAQHKVLGEIDRRIKTLPIMQL